MHRTAALWLLGWRILLSDGVHPLWVYWSGGRKLSLFLRGPSSLTKLEELVKHSLMVVLGRWHRSCCSHTKPIFIITDFKVCPTCRSLSLQLGWTPNTVEPLESFCCAVIFSIKPRTTTLPVSSVWLGPGGTKDRNSFSHVRSGSAEHPWAAPIQTVDAWEGLVLAGPACALWLRAKVRRCFSSLPPCVLCVWAQPLLGTCSSG